MTQRSKNPIFPNVPKSTDDFRGWHNWATGITNYLAGFVVDRDPPGVITLAAPVAVGLGVQLHWTTNHNATSYHVLRNDSNDPTTALVIGILPGRRNVSFFDPVGTSTAAVTLFYWVQPFNENVSGPISNMGSVLNPVVAAGGGTNLPFTGGPLGNGMHGSIVISANTTATSEIPIYQLDDLTVQSGKTWTAYVQNPGGFIIACMGRATIAGTIDVSARGGAGGTAISSTVNGTNGQIGYQFGGSGAGGGSPDTGSKGGHGGPIYKEYPYGNYNPSLVARQTAQSTNWYGDSTTAPTLDQLRRESASNVLNGGAGAFDELSTGGAGTALTAFPAFTQSFSMLWSLYRDKLFGWGGGGGGGGRTAGTSGAGGGGGGGFILLCEELDFTGTVNANGAVGGNGTTTSGGGGGGGGGMVLIGYRTLIANSGTITTAGGAGGNGAGIGTNGGAGGAGFSKVFDMRI